MNNKKFAKKGKSVFSDPSSSTFKIISAEIKKGSEIGEVNCGKIALDLDTNHVAVSKVFSYMLKKKLKT